MPGRGSKNHTHKYYQVRIANENVWACGEIDCSHYMPKHMEEAFMKGKLSICWGCGKKFLFDESLKEAAIKKHNGRAHCMECDLGINENEVPSLNELKL